LTRPVGSTHVNQVAITDGAEVADTAASFKGHG
jgi:hypothetical protein